MGTYAAEAQRSAAQGSASSQSTVRAPWVSLRQCHAGKNPENLEAHRNLTSGDARWRRSRAMIAAGGGRRRAQGMTRYGGVQITPSSG